MLKKDIKNEAEAGFMTMDVILLAAVLLAAAAVWQAASLVYNAQNRAAGYVQAGFLAQQRLNEMEYDLLHDTSLAAAEPNFLICNGLRYEVSQRTMQSEKATYLYDLEVEVKWHYGGAEQSEYQKRQVIKRQSGIYPD